MYLEQQCIWNNNVSGTTMYLEQQCIWNNNASGLGTAQRLNQPLQPFHLDRQRNLHQFP